MDTRTLRTDIDTEGGEDARKDEGTRTASFMDYNENVFTRSARNV